MPRLVPTLATLVISLLAQPARAAEEEGPAEEPLLLVVPLGAPDPALIRQVADGLRRTFRFRVEIGRGLPLPPEAYYAPRKRWRAERLLDLLDATSDPGARRVAGITEEPISTTKGAVHDWGIAGLGSLGGKSSVFTSHLFARYKRKEPRTYARYMENLVLHEVGHTLGLDHCPNDQCIMADAKGNAIRSARISQNEFCPRCYQRIRRWLRQEGLRGVW